MVCYSRLFKNFPKFVLSHTIEGFSIINEAEVDVFLKFFCFFFYDLFSKFSLYIWKFKVYILLKPSLENFEHYFTSV